jgi:S1-C subfamily serine protease
MTSILKFGFVLFLSLFFTACGHSLNIASDPKTATASIRVVPPERLRLTFLFLSGMPVVDTDYRNVYLMYVAKQGLGSGFAVARSPKENGLVVTNRHVVEGSETPQVSFDGGDTTIRGKIVYIDPENDIAVLEAPYPLPGLPFAATYADAQTVIALGYPGTNTGGYFQTTRGSISNSCAKESGFVAGGSTTCWIQHTASIDLGLSGGPLLTLDNKVIGINTGHLKDRHDAFFAVPVQLLQAAVRNAETVIANRTNRKWMTEQLKDTCYRFVSEMSSSQPRPERILSVFTFNLVAEKGALVYEQEYNSEVRKVFFEDPLKGIQTALVLHLHKAFESSGGAAKAEHCERVNPGDDVLSSKDPVRTLVSLGNGKTADLSWRYELGSWHLSGFVFAE